MKIANLAIQTITANLKTDIIIAGLENLRELKSNIVVPVLQAKIIIRSISAKLEQ